MRFSQYTGVADGKIDKQMLELVNKPVWIDGWTEHTREGMNKQEDVKQMEGLMDKKMVDKQG